jgi:2-iminobutanoate/2-iminopropanoate deaminase
MESQSKLTRIFCSQAPQPNGHYAQAILHSDTIYISGQLGITKGTPDPEKLSVSDQMLFALRNIENIAGTMGASRSDVIKTTIYVTGIEHWNEANRAYASFFSDHKPARSVVPCRELHFGAKIEVEAIIALPSAAPDADATTTR